MREKAKALWASIIILSISLIVCFFLWFATVPYINGVYLEFFKMLFGGIFSSSFVTTIIYCTEYRSVRRTELEKFWFAARDISALFQQIYYFDLKVSPEIAIKYFEEKNWNQMIQGQIDQVKEHGGTIPADDPLFSLNYECRDAWCNELRLNYGNDFAIFDYILINEIERESSVILKNLNKAIDSYIKIVQNGWSELDRVLGSIWFFSGKAQYNKIHSSIYSPIREMIISIKCNQYGLFSLFKEDNLQYAGIAVRMILDLQKKIFTEEISGGFLNVYEDFFLNLDRNIEDFRITIYPREKPKYLERTAFLRKTIDRLRPDMENTQDVVKNHGE